MPTDRVVFSHPGLCLTSLTSFGIRHKIDPTVLDMRAAIGSGSTFNEIPVRVEHQKGAGGCAAQIATGPARATVEELIEGHERN